MFAYKEFVCGQPEEYCDDFDYFKAYFILRELVSSFDSLKKLVIKKLDKIIPKTFKTLLDYLKTVDKNELAIELLAVNAKLHLIL